MAKTRKNGRHLKRDRTAFARAVGDESLGHELPQEKNATTATSHDVEKTSTGITEDVVSASELPAAKKIKLSAPASLAASKEEPVGAKTTETLSLEEMRQELEALKIKYADVAAENAQLKAKVSELERDNAHINKKATKYLKDSLDAASRLISLRCELKANRLEAEESEDAPRGFNPDVDDSESDTGYATDSSKDEAFGPDEQEGEYYY